jgi:hypothetical protein
VLIGEWDCGKSVVVPCSEQRPSLNDVSLLVSVKE